MAFKFAKVLTGGIGTGKSTASSLFFLHGFQIIDADKIAHIILDRETEIIKKEFGDNFVNNQIVNRRKLGKLVFKNPDALKKLEDILHPKIYSEIEAQSEKLDNFGIPYLIDLPLFFEKKNYPIQESILVYAPREIQIKRVMERDNLSRDEVEKRLNAQIDIEEKRKLATYILDNSSTLKHFQKEIENLINKFNER